MRSEHFRGHHKGNVLVFQQHTLLVGGNNIGKSTVCEALELVLGPERLYRRPVIDEHDFSDGAYLGDEGDPCEICVRAVLTDLSDEQLRRFFQHVRRWDDEELSFIDEEPDGLQAADCDGTVWALPVSSSGVTTVKKTTSLGTRSSTTRYPNSMSLMKTSVHHSARAAHSSAVRTSGSVASSSCERCVPDLVRSACSAVRCLTHPPARR